jgi:hypothetical protein
MADTFSVAITPIMVEDNYEFETHSTANVKSPTPSQ